MIDQRFEYIYNVLLSIFLGIIIVLIIDRFFVKPRIKNVYMSNPRDQDDVDQDLTDSPARK